MFSANAKALEAYQGVGLSGVVEEANPVEIIRMLMDGFLNRVASAEGHIRRGDNGAKATAISKALNILDGLRFSLDMEKGGDMSQRLDQLYEYLAMRLFQANVSSDLDTLTECRALMMEIRSAWVSAHSLSGPPVEVPAA